MLKAELDEVMRRKRECYNNMFKAHTKLQKRYNKALKALIEVRNFEIKIYNNLVELLKAIKEYILNYQQSYYNIAIISDTFRVFLNYRQYSKKSL